MEEGLEEAGGSGDEAIGGPGGPGRLEEDGAVGDEAGMPFAGRGRLVGGLLTGGLGGELSGPEGG